MTGWEEWRAAHQVMVRRAGEVLSRGDVVAVGPSAWFVFRAVAAAVGRLGSLPAGGGR